MYTTHSSPNRAHTVAVATPCCPAPVSAMMRRLPIRSASSACPIVLLILCAPVWFRSSRLRNTGAPTLAPRRGARVSGEGRPTNSREQRLELRPERRVGPRRVVERGRDRPARPPASPARSGRRRARSVRATARSADSAMANTASRKRAILSGSLMPGRCSTPELTSTTSGRTRAMARPTLSGGARRPAPSEPAEPGSRASRARARSSDTPVPPSRAGHPGLDQHRIGAVARLAAAARDPPASRFGRTRHTRSRFARGAAASSGRTSPCSWRRARPARSRVGGFRRRGCVAEDAEHRDAARRRHDVARAARGVDPPRASSKNDAQVGGPGRRGRRGVLGPGQPADLDLNGHGAAPAELRRGAPPDRRRRTARCRSAPRRRRPPPRRARRRPRSAIPLSATAMTSAGTAPKSRQAAAVSIRKVSRSRLLTPTISRAGVERARRLGRPCAPRPARRAPGRAPQRAAPPAGSAAAPAR